MDWFPWYPALYRADTLDMTLEQDGAYRRLIDHYMETRLPLPDNNNSLARIIGISVNEFQAIADQVRCKFKTKGEHLHNKRCDIELNRQDGLSKKRSNVAKAAHKKRNENKDKQASAGQERGNCGDTGQDRTGETKEEDSCSDQEAPTFVIQDHGEGPSFADTPFQTKPEDAAKLIADRDKDLLGDQGSTPQPVKFPSLKALGNGQSRKYPVEFERFWKAYPKRPSQPKGPGYTSWHKAEKIVGVESLEASALAYAQTKSAIDGFSQLITVWVNQEGYTVHYGTAGGEEAQTPYLIALAAWLKLKDEWKLDAPPLPPKPQKGDYAQPSTT